MRKRISGFLAAIFILIFSFTLASCEEKATKVAPVFNGMALSTTSPFDSASSVTKTMSDDTTTEEEPKEETPEIEVPEDDMPPVDMPEPIEDVVLPTISVDPSANQTEFYSNPKEDVFLSVSIVNPDYCSILRFTLNGVVYQSYQFEDGSNSELLVLKVEAPEDAGLHEYTIDQIKYVEEGSNTIRDVVIEGNQTVKLLVAETKVPTVNLTNEAMELSRYTFDLYVSDPSGLCTFENDVNLYLSDGKSIIQTVPLKKGDNHVVLDNLQPGKRYEYCVVAVYNALDKAGNSAHIISQKKFSASMFCKFSNVSSTKTSITYDYSVLSDAGSISKIILFDKNGKAVAEGNSTNEFTNLYSGCNYELRLYFNLEIEGKTYTYYDSFEIETKAYKVPQVSATYTLGDTVVNYAVQIDDDDELLTIKSVKLYNAMGDFISSSKELSGELTGLSTNANYYLTINYEYDLHDGEGLREGTRSITFSTTKAAPKVEILPALSTDTTMKFEVLVTDPNVVGQLKKISLYTATNHAFVSELNDVVAREFKNLTPNTAYVIEASYIYDMNDGRGSQVATFSCDMATAKTEPTAKFSYMAGVDSIAVTLIENDPDDAGDVEKIEVYIEDELIKTVEEAGALTTVANLLSGFDYTLKVFYKYNLNDYATKDQYIIDTVTTKTMKKELPKFTATEDTKVTYSTIDFVAEIDDFYKVCELKSVKMYLGEILVKDFEKELSGSLDGLYSNNKYRLVFEYDYDLNDATGKHSTTGEVIIKTLKRDDIVYTYTDLNAGATSIEFDLAITDKEKLSTLVKIELVDASGNVVQTLTDTTTKKFEGLAENSFYLIKTYFDYDMNDNQGVVHDVSALQFGTSGYEVTIDNIFIINNQNPAVGEAIDLRMNLNNPNNLNVTAVYISGERVELANYSTDNTDVVINFIPESTGGRYTLEVTGYDYESNGVTITKQLNTDFIEDIIIMGTLEIVDYFAVSDTYYEAFGASEMRMLEINNPTGYVVKEITYVSSWWNGQGDKSFNQTTNFEMIDDNHVLIKQDGIEAPTSESSVRDLVITKIKYGLDDVERELSLDNLSAPMQTYKNVIHISTPEELASIDTSITDNSWGYNRDAANYYILDNDIDLRGMTWTGLNGYGVFDGNGYTIKNLSISVDNPAEGSENFVRYGLFARFDGIIFNVNVENVYIKVITGSNNAYVAGICASRGRVYDSRVSGIMNVTSNGGFVAGISCDVASKNYYHAYDAVSSNNTVENLLINVTGTIDAAIVQNLNTYNKQRVGTTSYDQYTADVASAAFGNTVLTVNGEVSYKLYKNDEANQGALFINKEFEDVTYNFVTNCDAVDNFSKTGAVVGSVSVYREGYEVEWYTTADFTGDKVTFPYMNEKGATLYAKWTRHAIADTRFTYERYGYTDANGKYVDGWGVKSFNGAFDDKETPVVVGGYYQGLPVAHIFYNAWEELRYDSNGEVYNDVWSVIKDYTVYLTNTILSSDSSVYAGNIYVEQYQKIKGRDYMFYLWNEQTNVYCDSASYDSLNKMVKKQYSWTERQIVRMYSDADNPFAKYCVYPSCDETKTRITATVTAANDVYSSTKYPLADLPYYFEKDGDLTYTIYNNTRFVTLNGQIYSNIEKITEDANFKYIHYTDGSVVIYELINQAATSFNLNDSEYTVSEIGASVFRNSRITSITLNEGLKAIGSRAFEGSKITSITFPSTLTTIGTYAFRDCDNLETVVMNDKINTISAYAFDDDNKLTNVTFGKGLKSIEDYAFQYCYNVKSYILPTGLKKIGSNVFVYTSANVFIPSTVSKVGERAFATYNNVNIYVAASRKPAGWSTEWDYRWDNSNQTIIYWNTKEVGSTAQYDYVINNNDEVVISKFNNTGVDKIIIPDNVVEIGPRACYDCSNAQYVIIPESVKIVGENAFNEKTQIFYKGNNAQGFDASISERVAVGFEEIVTGEDFVYGKCGTYAYIIDFAKEYTKALVNFNLGGDLIVASLGNISFNDNYNIRTVIVPENVKALPNSFIRYCWNLESVTLNEGLEVIGEQALFNTNLRQLVIPSTVTTIKHNAIAYNDIKVLRIPDSVTSVDYYALRLSKGCVVIHNHSERIPSGWSSEAFGNGSEATKVIYNDNESHIFLAIDGKVVGDVETIINKTLTEAPTVTLSNGTITGWYESPAYEESELVTFPYEASGIKTIYAKIDYLTEVVATINGKEVTLASGANNYEVTQAQLESSITNDDYRVTKWYKDSEHTVEAVFPLEVEVDNTYAKKVELYPEISYKVYVDYYIPGWGSYNATSGYGSVTVKSINRSDSSYKIEGYYYDEALTNPVTFPLTVTANNDSTKIVKLYAKAQYKNYLRVYPDAESTDWTEYASGYGSFVVNEAPTSSVKYYYVEGWYTSSDFVEGTKVTFPLTVSGTIYIYPNLVKPTRETSEDGTYQYFVDADGNKTLVTYFGNSTVVDLSSETDIVAIGVEAFKDNKTITKVILPEGLKSIQDSAFSGCEKMTEITLPATLTSLGKKAFYGCSKLASITIPSGVTTIPEKAFYCCYNLSTVVLPSTIKAINNQAFYNCSSLKAIELPEGLDRLEDSAFSYTSISILTIPSTVTYVGYSAVYIKGGVVITNEASRPSNWSSSFYGWTEASNKPEVIYNTDDNWVILVVNGRHSQSDKLAYLDFVKNPSISCEHSYVEGWYTTSTFEETSKVDLTNAYAPSEHIVYLYAKTVACNETHVTYHYVYAGEDTTSGQWYYTTYVFDPASETTHAGKVIEGWYTTSTFDENSKITEPMTILNTDLSSYKYVHLYAKVVDAE